MKTCKLAARAFGAGNKIGPKPAFPLTGRYQESLSKIVKNTATYFLLACQNQEKQFSDSETIVQKYFIACVTLLLMTSSPTLADGSFIPNYGAWKALSQPSKLAYIAGSLDQLMNGMYSDSFANSSNKAEFLGALDCIKSNGITTQIFVEMVEQRYLKHTEEWSFGPSPVLVGALLEVCKPQINEERRKLNLEPLSGQ